MSQKNHARHAQIGFLCSFIALLAVTLACASTTPEVKTPTQPQSGNQEASPTLSQTESQETSPTQELSANPTTPPATDAPKPLGSARSNPAPIGSEVNVDEYTIKVTDIVVPADAIVKKGNSFNSKPEPGNQYIFVNTAATCNKSTDESCSLAGFEFSLIDSAGIAHDPEIFIAGVDGLFEPGEFFGGATKTGYIPFIVPIDDTKLILRYSGILGSDAYFAIQ
jgi:hypothetical protein